MSKGSFITFFLLALLFVSDGLRAETQFGLNGLQTWTNNEQIEHPAGVGFYISQSVSGRIRLQFDYGYNYESRKFVATFHRGFPPFPGDTVRDYFEARTWARSYDFSVIGDIVKERILAFSIGGGLSFINLNHETAGQDSGYRIKDDDFAFGLNLIADVEIVHPSLAPLIFHFGYRQRLTLGTGTYITDSYEILSDGIFTSDVRFSIGLDVSDLF